MTREQYTEYVTATQGAFRRFLLAMCCGDGALADDVAQESYIKAYLAIDNIRELSHFNAWIYKIGYNTYLNHRRGVRMFTSYDAVDDVCTPERADKAFDYQSLYAAVGELPDKERMAVLLYYMQNYSAGEIAELMETSDEAVRQYLSRGRKKLRILLSEEE